MYPTRTVILVEAGYCFTLSTDAISLHLATELTIELHDEIEICYFHYDAIEAVLAAVASAGIEIVICDPPETSACHLFN